MTSDGYLTASSHTPHLIALFVWRRRGLYVYQLEWLQHFPEEQLMVVNYHEVREEPMKDSKEMHGILTLPNHSRTISNLHSVSIRYDESVAS